MVFIETDEMKKTGGNSSYLALHIVLLDDTYEQIPIFQVLDTFTYEHGRPVFLSMNRF